MLKSLQKKSLIKQKKEMVPSQDIVNSILNYSKSIDVVKVQDKKILIHLN